MHRRILLLLLTLCPIWSLAQKETAIWYFGGNAGIDFNGAGPVPLLDGKVNTHEGCSVICNSDGQVILYTDGGNVWNKNHNLLENGAMLSGSTTTTQSAIIVPWPNRPGFYYIFTLIPEFSNTKGVDYSIADMNSGSGKIISKNNLLSTLSYEKIMATPHSNNTDYWIVIPIWGDNTFKSFLLSANGISDNPVISSSGPIHFSGGQYGVVKISRKDNWLCVISHNSIGPELYKFNNTTGEINHVVSLPTAGIFYGIEFSPDESKLYISGYKSPKSILYQYDLSSPDPDDIIASETFIGNVANRHFGALQVAPDHKIYASKHDNFNGDLYLGVINAPNEKGAACNFIEDGFYLGGRVCYWGLPTVVTDVCTYECSFEIENYCAFDTLIVHTDSDDQDSLQWTFDDYNLPTSFSTSNPGYHTYTEPGIYTIHLKKFYGENEINCDSTIEIHSNPYKQLQDEYSICDNDSIKIELSDEYVYLWNDNTNESIRYLNASGEYWLQTISSEGCIRSDTVEVTVSPSPQFNLGNDTIICNGEYLTLYIPANLYQYQWQDGSTDPWMVAREQGLYWVKITNHEGCSNRDSLFLTLSSPTLQLASDTLLCDNDSLYLIAGSSLFTYQWNNGSSDTAQWVFDPGIVSVTAYDSLGCSAEAQTLIEHLDAPNIFLPTDTAFCSNSPITLRVDAPHSELLWNTGETGAEITPEYPGLYHVTAENRCGFDSDSVWVEIYEIPIVDLGPDTVLFPGSTTTLFAGEGFVTYLWTNGFSTPEIQISEPGTYYVEVWNQHCANTDTLNIKLINPLRVPNVFTPNSDGYNDEFEIIGEYLQRFHLTIINRWGETLFESFDINNRWQGTHNNSLCADGAYFWIIRYQYPTMERSITIQGTVTILRN